MSRGHLTNGRGMSEATKPVIKHAVFREMSGGIIALVARYEKGRDATPPTTHTHVHIYIYIYILTSR